MSDECVELKNIKYQSMLLSNNFNTPETLQSNINDLDELMKLQSMKSLNKPWSKLDKLSKLKRIYAYVESIQELHSLNDDEVKGLKKYLKQCFERKKLQRVKDVTYDKSVGTILDIPGLVINKALARKFTLKQVDKKGSTLKNLTKIKKRTKQLKRMKVPKALNTVKPQVQQQKELLEQSLEQSQSLENPNNTVQG